MNVLSEIKAEQSVEGDDLWFKDAIIYQLHVRAFADSNNDGIGDFAGLTHQIAISGFHVGLVAGFGALLARILFLALPRAGRRVARPPGHDHLTR